MEARDIARLGEAVKKRRERLGLTQDDLRGLGGPSNTTVSQIEQGAAETVSPLVQRKLDASLSWEAGTARALLEGGTDQAEETDPLADLWNRVGALERRVARLEESEATSDGAPIGDETSNPRSRRGKGTAGPRAREESLRR